MQSAQLKIRQLSNSTIHTLLQRQGGESEFQQSYFCPFSEKVNTHEWEIEVNSLYRLREEKIRGFSNKIIIQNHHIANGH